MVYKDLEILLEQPGQSLLRHLLNIAPVPAGLAIDTKIVYVNPACAAFWGFESPAQMYGRSFFQNLAPEWHDMMQQIWMMRPSTAETLTFELEGIRPDGTRLPHSATDTCFELPEGKLSFAYFRPVEVCTPAEVQLQRLREQLRIAS